MDFNVLAYCVFLPVAFAATFKTGWTCYRNGAHYLEELMRGDVKLAHAINRFLLIGYLLLNMGYIAVSLRFWESIGSAEAVILSCTSRMGYLLLLLGVMHYFNMLVTYLIRKKQKNSPNNLNQ